MNPDEYSGNVFGKRDYKSPHNQEEFSDKEAAKKALLSLLPRVDRLFESEQAVLKSAANQVMLIGDIHGDLKALEFILEIREKMRCEHLLFLGDYVDRGQKGVEVLIKLFRLKLAEPENVLLLRGNHETVDMNIYYGFFGEIGHDPDFLRRVNLTFELMPVAAVLSGKTFCVHGGLPGPVRIEHITKEGAFSYLWNDPSEKPGLSPSRRGSTVNEFGPDVVEEFLQRNHLKRIVRGHTALKEGYEWWFDGKLLSLFSCPDYVGLGNDGAFALLKGDEIEIFSFDHSKKVLIKKSL